MSKPRIRHAGPAGFETAGALAQSKQAADYWAKSNDTTKAKPSPQAVE